MLLKETSLPLLRHPASASTSLLNHQCRRGSVFTTGILGPDVERNTLLRSKLQESGTSLPYKKLLTKSNTKSFMNGFMCSTLRAVRFSSTRTPSTLTSASNRSSFTTRGDVCKIFLSKENMDRCCKAFCHVLLFVVLQPVVRKSVISQNIDLVAGDFNGAAWRCRSRDNLTTIDEAFADCALPTKLGTTPLWGPGSIPNNWADVCGFIKPPGSQRFWKVSEHGAFSIPRQALGLRSSDKSCHHETWLHLHLVDRNNTWSPQAHYNGNIRLKERPQKRHISELLSDHSLSS